MTPPPKTPPLEYGWHCENCTQRKKYGAARLTRDGAATRHWMRFWDHVVILTETKITGTMRREDSAYHQLGDDAPF